MVAAHARCAAGAGACGLFASHPARALIDRRRQRPPADRRGRGLGGPPSGLHDGRPRRPASARGRAMGPPPGCRLAETAPVCVRRHEPAMQEDSHASGQLLDAARRTAANAPPGPQRLSRRLRRHGPGCYHASPGTRPTNMSSPKHDRNTFDRAGKPAVVTPTPLVRYLASVETADAAEEDAAGVRRLKRDGVIGTAVPGIIVRQAAGWFWADLATPPARATPASIAPLPPSTSCLTCSWQRRRPYTGATRLRPRRRRCGGAGGRAGSAGAPGRPRPGAPRCPASAHANRNGFGRCSTCPTPRPCARRHPLEVVSRAATAGQRTLSRRFSRIESALSRCTALWR